MSERSGNWADILRMTRSMLVSAEQQDWSTVASAEVERRRALELFFATKVSVDEAEAVAEGIRQLMTLDAQIMNLGAVARDQVARQAGALHRSRRAEAAYNANR